MHWIFVPPKCICWNLIPYGRDWGQEEKGTTEDGMAGWHHWLDGRESQWIPGVGDGQGGLVCCDSWGCKKSDMTERLIWSDLNPICDGIWRWGLWEGLRAGGEGNDRGWDGWMASPTQWIWVWVDSGSWWWTGRPGLLWFMGSQRVGHDWTELIILGLLETLIMQHFLKTVPLLSSAQNQQEVLINRCFTS